MQDALQVILTRLNAMGHSFLTAAPNLVMGLAVLLVFWFLGKLARQGANHLSSDAGQPPEVARVFGRLAAWAVNIVGMLLALSVVAPSVDAATLFSTLGVGGVAIGFAFKDILQNLLAGLLLLISRPFKLGDQIVSGSDEGVIEDIELRATRMRTFDNRIVLIPNSQLFTSRVVVNTANERRRASIQVSMSGDDSIEMQQQRLLQAVQHAPSVLDTPAPTALLMSAAPGESQFELRVWTNPATRKNIAETSAQVVQALHERVENCSAKWTA